MTEPKYSFEIYHCQLADLEDASAICNSFTLVFIGLSIQSHENSVWRKSSFSLHLVLAPHFLETCSGHTVDP